MGLGQFRYPLEHLRALLPLELLHLHKAGKCCRTGPVPHSEEKKMEMQLLAENRVNGSFLT